MGSRSLSMVLYDALGRAATTVANPVLPVVAMTRIGRGLSERLGELPDAVRALVGRQPLWVHAASVGEVLACGPLVDGLRASRPQRPILITTTSLTGRETARKLSGVDAAMLMPFDLRRLIAQTLAALRPAGLVIVETEIWPGLLHAARDAGIGAIVVSGRISERAARRYSLIRPLVRDTLRCVAAFGMQTQADAERVIALGAPVERVRVTGSLKYARLLPRLTTPHALPGVDGRPLLIAASTQPGEEEIVVDACSAIWATHPDCLLVLAPRRPERFDEADELLRRRGVRRQRRSSLGAGVDRQTQVVLLDSVGELPALLGAALAVFVGGTIAPLGGHNVLEPAAAGSAVCFGPHTENVAEAAASLLAAGGAALVRDSGELRSLWQQLLADPDAAYAMGARARQVVEAREQVLADTVALVERALP